MKHIEMESQNIEFIYRALSNLSTFRQHPARRLSNAFAALPKQLRWIFQKIRTCSSIVYPREEVISALEGKIGSQQPGSKWHQKIERHGSFFAGNESHNTSTNIILFVLHKTWADFLSTITVNRLAPSVFLHLPIQIVQPAPESHLWSANDFAGRYG